MKKCFCLLLTLLCISYSAVAAPGFRIKGKIVDPITTNRLILLMSSFFVKEMLIQCFMLYPIVTVRFA